MVGICAVEHEDQAEASFGGLRSGRMPLDRVGRRTTLTAAGELVD
jgi:hypothetical protein